MTNKWKRIVWLVVEAMLFVFVLVAVCGILLLLAGVFSTMLGIDMNDKDMNSPFAMLSEGGMAIGCVLGLWVVDYVHRHVFPQAKDYGMGLALKGGHMGQLLAGIGVAAGLYAAGFLVVWLLGGIGITDVGVQPGALVQTLAFFLLVAVFEEGMCRGFLLGRMMDAGINKFAALVLSSAVFSCLHLANPGFALLPFINLLLAGVLLGAAYIYTRNLWFAIGLHWFWNWLQGPILGFEVSGNVLEGSLLTLEEPVEAVLLNGGTFGFEGSLVCTVLMVAGIGFIIRHYEKKRTLAVND